MNYTFTGNQDIDHVLLSSLNKYDLYNICITSKKMLTLCQQNQVLYEKYLNVQNIIKTVNHYIKSRKFLSFGKSNFDVNLKNLLPMINDYFNFVYPVEQIKIDIIRKRGMIEILPYKKII